MKIIIHEKYYLPIGDTLCPAGIVHEITPNADFYKWLKWYNKKHQTNVGADGINLDVVKALKETIYGNIKDYYEGFGYNPNKFKGYRESPNFWKSKSE